MFCLSGGRPRRAGFAATQGGWDAITLTSGDGRAQIAGDLADEPPYIFRWRESFSPDIAFHSMCGSKRVISVVVGSWREDGEVAGSGYQSLRRLGGMLRRAGHARATSSTAPVCAGEVWASLSSSAPSTSMFGTIRSSHFGNHHACFPRRCMAAGMRSRRTTNASIRTPKESPKPMSLTVDASEKMKPAKTEIMIAAAAATTARPACSPR